MFRAKRKPRLRVGYSNPDWDWPDEVVYRMMEMDPIPDCIEAVSGLKFRLSNFGFYYGFIDYIEENGSVEIYVSDEFFGEG